VVGNLFEDVSLVAGHDLSHLAIAADRESKSLSLQVLMSNFTYHQSWELQEVQEVVNYRSHFDQSIEVCSGLVRLAYLLEVTLELGHQIFLVCLLEETDRDDFLVD
jgi:hypothetical protein